MHRHSKRKIEGKIKVSINLVIVKFTFNLVRK